MAVASAEGGMDIEAVAEENPDAIIKTPIDIMEGASLCLLRLCLPALSRPRFGALLPHSPMPCILLFVL